MMKLLLAKTKTGLDLTGVQLSLDGCTCTVVGMAKQEYKDGLLWQYWIIMDDTGKEEAHVQSNHTHPYVYAAL